MDFRRALIEEQVATPEELERASARQELYGGDLVTNLLDARAIDERGAARALCRAHALAPAPLGELPYGSAQAIELLPRETASSMGIYPYRLDGDTFTIIAGGPPDAGDVLQLSETLGVKIRVLLALTPRVKQALARDYAQPLEPRVQKALARLEGKTPPNTIPASPLLDGPSFSRLPQPPSIAPVGFPRLWDDGDTPTEAQLSAETAPAPPVVPRFTSASSRNPVQQTRPAAAPAPAWSEPGSPSHAEAPAPPAVARGRRPRHRGPYTAAEATKDLTEATGVDELLPIYFDYAAQYFDRCALFTLHRTGVQLREHRGLGSVAADGSEHGLASHPTLQEVAHSGRWLLTNLAETDPKLHELLAARGNAQWLLLPIRVRGRVALVLVGGFDDSDVNLVDTGDLIAFEPAMSQALQRAIVARKREQRAEAGRSSAEQPAVHPGQASLIPKRALATAAGQDRQHGTHQSTPPMPMTLGVETQTPGRGGGAGVSGPGERG